MTGSNVDAGSSPVSDAGGQALPVPSVDRPLRVLSLGAGVQSTAVLLMAIEGEIEPIDVAIFSDTGWEPVAVYEHLERLEAAAIAGGVPIHRVSAGNIRDDHVRPEGEHLFVRNPKKKPENLGTLRVSIPLYTLTSAGPTFADGCPKVCGGWAGDAYEDFRYCGRPLPCSIDDHDTVACGDRLPIIRCGAVLYDDEPGEGAGYTQHGPRWQTTYHNHGAALTWVEKIKTVDAIDQADVAGILANPDWRLLHVGVGSGGQTTLTFGWPYVPPAASGPKEDA